MVALTLIFGCYGLKIYVNPDFIFQVNTTTFKQFCKALEFKEIKKSVTQIWSSFKEMRQKTGESYFDA